MRVFVTGTGRCGTVTFAKACEKIQGFTSAHESHAGRIDLEYPDNHIEVDPHLVWILPDLRLKYPDSVFVVLHRDREIVVDSLARRASTKAWGRLAFQNENLDPVALAERLHDFVLGVIAFVVGLTKNFTSLKTPVTEEYWKHFLSLLGNPPVEDGAIEILQVVHNATRTS